MAKIIPDRYAQAFFELALELGRLDDLERDARSILTALDTGGLQAFLLHPQISADEKSATMRNIFHNISDETFGLANVIFCKNREKELYAILDLFLAKAKAYRGVITAKVKAARPLTAEQTAKITALLASKLNKEVEVISEVDPSVLGGLAIHVEGRIFDSTLKKKLKGLKASLYSRCHTISHGD